MLSFKENIPIILSVIEAKAPKRIIDVGAGMGKYGILAREQYISSLAEKRDLQPADDIVIDAIEDTEYFVNFRNKQLGAIYNNLFTKSVFDCVDVFATGNYDMTLMIDVIEHWTKEDTLSLMAEILPYTNILVSTPKRTGMYKDHFYGDPRHHITQWTEADFDGLDLEVIPTGNTRHDSHIIYIKKQ
jgi:2-polyprenyl-3-methyl-5-hydroxy-6-metoxy-1,4-benzoquinol methylase